MTGARFPPATIICGRKTGKHAPNISRDDAFEASSAWSRPWVRKLPREYLGVVQVAVPTLDLHGDVVRAHFTGAHRGGVIAFSRKSFIFTCKLAPFQINATPTHMTVELSASKWASNPHLHSHVRDRHTRVIRAQRASGHMLRASRSWYLHHDNCQQRCC